ncbi:GNAT family N-acetyltransferase [Enterovirga sp.]|uniref:GNAT family N-acetyltransferase n=1 Tax=Enterovirga sp. TaxID=2026350 RepID=UPI002CBC4956|nr:GNAT family N-acetyltransferase [Enterovirga sp.]HMO28249.1 GNAT family N-acetyltransferase [Enterovirga sp.]
MSEPRQVEIRIARSLGAVEAADWDACANPPEGAPPGLDETHNPFVSHAFLSALEESGCVGGRSGWTPLHLLVADADGKLAAAAPCYAKSHSMGEYVFDGGWADAYERAGGRYYPKLQVAVPFTPVTGPRLLVQPDAGPEAHEALVGGLKALQGRIGASSTHVTFISAEESRALAQDGYLVRTDKQFHWLDEGYGDFETFLSALASRKRKVIRRERREALADGITIAHVTGRDITEAHWDAFFAFYMDTGSRKWGRPYLNRRFFSLVGERMAERILLVIASRNGRPIAGAINFIGDRALYGRNWGCIEDHPFLHFEVCYYQAIDFALARGLRRVEAGAQGEHKLARGYRPVTTHSAHDIADPNFRRAVADYLVRERSHVAAVQAEYEEALPYRRVTAEDD